MLRDRVRMSAWEDAIRQNVKPGDVVVDVGTGTGILSFMACAVGARRVYAIEEASILEVARELAPKTGFSDRIVFISEKSIDVTLPEQADVVLGDVFGAFGLNGNLLPTMIDARDRFLKPGGTLIPLGVELFCAPVEVPDFYNQTIEAWSSPISGFDHQPCRRRAVNQMHLYALPPGAVLASPASLGRIFLGEVSTTAWKGSARFQFIREARFHAIAGWCTAWFTPHTSASNSPLEPDLLSWHQAVFPLDDPLLVRDSDQAAVEFELSTHGEWAVWTWQATLISPGRNPVRFRHSTFEGELLSIEKLRRQTPGYAPRTSLKGEVVRAVLELSDGTRTSSQISEEISRRYPDQFPDPSAASRLIRQVVLSLCT